MKYNEVAKRFILGGTVYYQAMPFSVIGMNELNHTFTIKSENKIITGVNAEELSKEVI